MIRIDHNVETGEIKEIVLSKTELDFAAKETKEIATLVNNRKAEVEAREAAKQAIADRLGLTADELKLLLG